ncbi:DDE transposase family protein [Leptolyngbya sp. FACHB-261]|uniref:DDE transposase family protein n=1 Tax=Leptolyngbya sp. FACHB-261 TaxID=2692806 RepID=UPI001688ACD5|nr:DDE transposase family protein [Leptolyngbya sp. FACHB-261]MBD2104138.1 DDE transposase family protein [Leptolyngbya sp. FACHB-261]
MSQSSDTDTRQWYILKRAEGPCQIVALDPASEPVADGAEALERWGPFNSQAEAIARRVGLIRAGKCQPV